MDEAIFQVLGRGGHVPVYSIMEPKREERDLSELFSELPVSTTISSRRQAWQPHTTPISWMMDDGGEVCCLEVGEGGEEFLQSHHHWASILCR